MYRYEEIAEETFGKMGRLIISSIIYVELFGTCCLLFILEVSFGARLERPCVNITCFCSSLASDGWADLCTVDVMSYASPVCSS